MQEANNETVTRLFVDAFKDRESFIEGLRREMDKVEILMESMGSSRAVLHSYAT